MHHIRRFLVTGALTAGLALAAASGAAGSATAAPAQPDTTGVTASPDGALAWSCGAWGEVLPPAVWGRSCRNSVPTQGAGEAFNGRSYDVRLRITVKSRAPWGDVYLGACDQWVAPGTYFRCGDFTLGAVSQYPVVAFLQQLQP
ncbi:hypothetical protein SAMN05216188_12378 [Lentzea xinjiangensis]|uniref:Secreted protein n=1 Tax=Lentzea xinjiangensis TaxID=402600 RepID=A0A1H9V004_9PSEU|nr:hypothetical protein [Lentzea xinjiangensis]SES15100.1 hypothetical protein SAMN05216188_12378 [Lentzea xinjiangensis]